MHPPFLPGPGVPGLVSVIVPTYNRAAIIGESIESVLAQTYANFEIIVIDDGSRDRTREVVSAYDDRRVDYVYKENGGLASARNAGIERARGEFIAFLDSDDVWHAWKLAAQVEIFRRHADVGMIWTDMSAFDDASRITAERYLRTYYRAYGRVDIASICMASGTLGALATGVPAGLADCRYYVGNVFREMFMGNLVHPPTAIVRRARLRAAGGFEYEVTRGGADDYHFYLRVTKQGPVAFLDAPAILYRVHDRSMTSQNRLREAHGDLRVLSYWHDTIVRSLPRSAVRSRFAGAHAWVGSEELYAGRPRAATPHLWRSLVLNPRQAFIASLLVVSLLPAGAVPKVRAVKRVVRRYFRVRIVRRAVE